MQKKRLSRRQRLTLSLAAFVAAVPFALSAEDNARPWMDKSLSPSERADLVLKQLTLDEKIALLHGNGMPHTSKWQAPLTYLGNDGTGYVEGIPRLGIPPIVISDAAYGVRSGGDNGRTHTAPPKPLQLGLTRSSRWLTSSAQR